MKCTGQIIAGPEFEPVEGEVVVEDGSIVEIEQRAVDSEDIVFPAFVNAHTHVGDSIAKDAGSGLDLEALVAPPDGLKHRLLAAASRAEQVTAMRRSLEFMQAGGTGTVLDFREQGLEGVRRLRDAADGLDIRALAYGRDDPAVLEEADGYGASGANDASFEEAREAARAAEKPFGIHAGERDASDVQAALDLDPDLLVHMVHAEDHHLEEVTNREIPIVVSPRSNLVTGVGLPPVERLLAHTTVAIGTDNVMLNSPSMFRELAFLSKCCDVDAPTALEMATRAGATVAGVDGGLIGPGEPARLVVLDGDSPNLAGYRDPVQAIVRRATVADVKRVLLPDNS